jgi:flagellar basal body-associated protein FliL
MTQELAPQPETPQKPKKKRGDIPLWVVILIGMVMMAISFSVMLFLVKPQLPAPPPKHLESWEYWSGRFYLKIDYNTSEISNGSRNWVRISKACLVEVSQSQTVGEAAFKTFVTNLTSNRTNDIILANRTIINPTNATIDTALKRIRAYYCAQKTYVVTSGRFCNLTVSEADCNL